MSHGSLPRARLALAMGGASAPGFWGADETGKQNTQA